MILRDMDDRAIEVTVTGPSAEELYISSATYMDSGEDADEETIAYLESAYAHELYMEYYENLLEALEAV